MPVHLRLLWAMDEYNIHHDFPLSSHHSHIAFIIITLTLRCSLCESSRQSRNIFYQVQSQFTLWSSQNSDPLTSTPFKILASPFTFTQQSHVDKMGRHSTSSSSKTSSSSGGKHSSAPGSGSKTKTVWYCVSGGPWYVRL